MIRFISKFIRLKNKYPKEISMKTLVFEGLTDGNPAKASWCTYALRSKIADGGLRSLRYNLILLQKRRSCSGLYVYIGQTQKRRTRQKFHIVWKKGK